MLKMIIIVKNYTPCREKHGLLISIDRYVLFITLTSNSWLGFFRLVAYDFDEWWQLSKWII